MTRPPTPYRMPPRPRLAVLVVCAAFGCANPTPPPTPGGSAAADDGWFRDVTAETGIAHTYRNGQEAGHLAILESLGGGAAMLDYDGDGRLDVFLTGGGEFAGPDKKEIRGLPSRLYRNLGGWRFADATAAAGLDGPAFYTHGAAVGDYDRDGWPDLLVTGWGRVVLYRNEADGRGGRRFADATARAGLTAPLWATSAAWADADGDGFADLYVCQYVDWSFANHPTCTYHDAKLPDVCPPGQFRGLPHKLFRNNGDGTFADASAAAGLLAGPAAEATKGLGVVAADLDGDGRPDFYVANDTTDNLLYLNRGGRLEETGVTAGAARDDRGVANGSMGVAVGDPDGSGRPALFVSNYQNELFALYRNDGGGLFTFHSQASGVAAVGRQHVGFGTAFADFDRDGREDLVVANGHVIRHPVGTTVAQKPVLLRNAGGGRFEIAADRGGDYFRRPHHGRGLAAGDLDDDGRIDLVVSHVNEPAAVLRNEAGAGAHWIGVDLVGAGRRDVVGAKVVLDIGGAKQTRFAAAGGSYLSSGDRRLLFGTGAADRAVAVVVEWPAGEPRRQTWDGLAVGRYHRLVQGEPAAR